MTVTEYISTHPKIALIVGLAHLTAAEVLTNVKIPEIVMQCFQIGAWTITIVIGMITIYGAIKRAYQNFKSRKGK